MYVAYTSYFAYSLRYEWWTTCPRAVRQECCQCQLPEELQAQAALLELCRGDA